MKKVLLTSTALATLLLAGGLSVSADVQTPESLPIPVDVLAGGADFTFNTDMAASITVDNALLAQEGTQQGQLLNVGGILNNRNLASESVTVSATSALPGLVVTGGTTVTAAEISTASESVPVDFTINRAAALASDEARVITVCPRCW
nr:hypothetical protein [Enterococcus innesii]